jgi:hypothetical protein
MSRTDRRRRSKAPSDLRARFLFDDLEALGVEHAADLAYRIALATFQPISDPQSISRAFECFELLNECGVPYVVCGGWATDLHFGRVLRDHDDIDLFVLDRDEERVLSRLHASTEFAVQAQTSAHRDQQRYKIRFRDALSIELFVAMQSGTCGTVWGGAVEFSLNGFELRRRQLANSNHLIGARTLSAELHYLFKLSGLKHFEGTVREKDLADIRAMLPLLNPHRLAEAKAAWRGGAGQVIAR